MVSIKVSDMVVGEGDSYVDMVVSLSEASTSAVSVNYATGSGTADHYDFVGISGNLLFAAGETTKVVRVELRQDTWDEGYERFWFNLDTPVNAKLAQSSAMISIIDDEANVETPQLYVDDVVVDEKAGTATFVVTLNGRTGGSSNSTIEVNYATSNGTAQAGSDYSATSGKLTFAPGESAQTVIIDITDDAFAESEETFNFTLSDAVNASIFDGTAVATIGLSDTTAANQPTIKVSDMVVGEGDSYVDMVVSLNAPSPSAVSVNYATGSGTADHYDFVGISGDLLFAAGETTKVVRVELRQDTWDEGYERFWFNLDTPVNAKLAQSSAMISIIDDEANVETPQLYVDDVVVDEKAGTATFVVMLNGRTGGSSNSTIEVNYATSNGTAQVGSDYSATSGELTFAPGESAQTVIVDITDDAFAESEETFNFTLSDAVNASIFDGTAVATIGLSDTTVANQPTIKVSDMVVGEGDSCVDMVVSLNAPSTSAVSVNYATGSGTADHYDFVGISGNLLFAAGETTKVVRVELRQDTWDEGYERFWFNLDTPVNAKLAQSSAMISIIDDEANVETPQLYVDDVVVDEKAGTATFVVTLNGRTGGSSNSTIEVNYATSNGTAQAGSDYSATSGKLTFAPGESAQTVIIDITDDAFAESEETFNFTLSDAVNASIFDGTAVATIGLSDTTAANQPTIKVSDMVVGEGDSYVDMVVSLNAPSPSAVSVNYATGSGTADHYDFVGISGNLLFAAGETTKVVRVELRQDAWDEGDERFYFTLDTPVNATIANASRSIYIYDDETNPTILRYGNSDDVYNLTSEDDIVIENLNGGNDTIRAPFSYTLSTAYGDGTASCYVENLTLTGSAAIDGTGNNIDNIITGNSNSNTLKGLDGNDTLIGGGGVDSMVGGQGDDLYIVDNTRDTTTEASGAGSDTVHSDFTWTLAANIEKLVLIGTQAINGTGNDLANTLTGNAQANVLKGLAGKDALYGLAGNDILNGGADADSMTGGSGNDTYFVDNIGDRISEASGEGRDTVNSTITWTLAANVENLVLSGTKAIHGTGNELANALTGNSGANKLYGSGGNDLLNGGAGNDTLNGGAGVDVLRGGQGNDTYFVDNANDKTIEAASAGTDMVSASLSWSLAANVEKMVLTGTESINGTGNGLANTITGNSGANKLVGNGGNDLLKGAAGNDVLNGGDGNDVLDGGAGTDTLIGGLGNDTYKVDNAKDKTIEATAAGIDTVNASLSWSLAANIEKLILTGTKSINGTGNGLANTITGNSGANKLIGNGGNDVLNGGSGNDILNGGVGVDVLRGGRGNDTYFVDNGRDRTIEATAAGIDTVNASLSWSLAANIEKLILTGTKSINGTGNGLANTITGNSGANKLIGNGGNDVLNGGSGNDILNGGAGVDVLRGGRGNDTYFVDNGRDRTIEATAAGIDTVNASLSWSLAANVENLVLTGIKSINGTGNGLANAMTGNSGANKLVGNGGNDVLNGGKGNDTLNGGTGRDVFIFNTALDESANIDTIVGFNATDDTIRLDQTVFFKLSTGELASANFQASESGAAVDKNDYILYNTTTGALLYDTDGSGEGVAVQFATLSNKATITASDFAVVA
ncbi:MAG: Calx-beta domain-containing protein [Desulfobulbus sp.]|nr:Calx-beta domain-containing protein [Desulfobulbus sp.]